MTGRWQAPCQTMPGALGFSPGAVENYRYGAFMLFSVLNSQPHNLYILLLFLVSVSFTLITWSPELGLLC